MVLNSIHRSRNDTRSPIPLGWGDSSVGYGTELVTLVMDTNPVAAITFSCAAIYFPLCITYSVIKGQFLSGHVYIVCGG